MSVSSQTLEVVVRATHDETSEIRSFVLERADGRLLPPFEAGAHIDVEPLPGLMRPYSLVGNPNDRQRYLIGVKKEPQSRGGSSAMHSAVRTGTTLRISTPKNNFALWPGTGRCILLAGGIGVTPLLSIAQVLHERDEPFSLHYFTRANDDLAFEDLIARSDWFRQVCFHFGLVPPGLTELLTTLLEDGSAEDQIYMCGPLPFMDLVRDTATGLGWSPEQIHFEHFSAAPPELSMDDDDFVLRLHKSGQELVVPADKTIIEALREAGIDLVTSCEQGICGTCLARVVEGEPEHRDMYLSDEEREEGLFAPCVSRARSKLLVLDL